MAATARSFCSRLGWLAAATLALVCALTRPAAAGPPWLRIDRIEAEPSIFDGLARVRLHVTAVDLRGAFIDDITGEDAWQLRIGTRRLQAPVIVGKSDAIGDELVIALVIQTTAGFEKALPAIKTQASAFLDKLPRQAQVLVLGYDAEIQGGNRVGSVARARQDLDKLEINPDPGDHLLLEAIERARKALAKVKPETPGGAQRKLIVVVSDGRDVDPRPESYRGVAKRAMGQDIRIQSIAFPPDGNRLPLRGLAELSKRSDGTFRFAYSEEGFETHFGQLLLELQGQYILTYYLSADEVAGKRLQLAAPGKDMESEPVRMPKLACGAQACEPGQYCAALRCVIRTRAEGRGVTGWLALIGGSAIGVVMLFVLLSLALSRYQRKRAAAEALAQAQTEAQAQAQAANAHRVVPHGPHGGPVQAHPASGAHPALPHSGAHPAAQSGAYQAMQQSQHPGQHRVQPIMPPQSGAHPAAQHPGQPHPHAAQAAGMRGPVPVLLVLNGPHQGKRIPLQHGFLIGKAPECHLSLPGDGFASGHHAMILMDTAGGCTLVDRGSTNGTFINGVRTSESRLVHGMLIKIGSTEARFLSQ